MLLLASRAHNFRVHLEARASLLRELHVDSCGREINAYCCCCALCASTPLHSIRRVQYTLHIAFVSLNNASIPPAAAAVRCANCACVHCSANLSARPQQSSTQTILSSRAAPFNVHVIML